MLRCKRPLKRSVLRPGKASIDRSLDFHNINSHKVRIHVTMHNVCSDSEVYG